MTDYPNIEIKLADGVSFTPATEGSAGIDLVANISEPVVVAPQAAPTMIPTGVWLNMSQNPGLVAFVLPRSGMGRKGLVLGNTIGLIDSDYQGEIMLAAWNRNPQMVRMGMGVEVGGNITVQPGDRVAQLVFMNVATPFVGWNLVEQFSNETARSEGGFGSTGVA